MSREAQARACPHSVWDAATGERIAFAPELAMNGFHPSARHTAGPEEKRSG